ncbi:helix-turn-helix transcriptional regulator [Pseudomonas sp. NFR16]|uniref:AraC family transcriptional regulator n=1 Tax=Pseudomonas sp. NFR16 TaxID=1566248 RepID=UPI0008CA4559|nr:helix-turn-helix transcriptional regulator [Pseudomonas sp. NFR16]SEI54078.1 transcriptional regulator, AraC family [Pseudomonas sp. NFR16]
MPDYLPMGAHQPVGEQLESQVQIQLFRHRSVGQTLTVPAVAEPLLVLVLSGAAQVQERAIDEQWTATAVAADDFFLTMSPEPYEMRWQTEHEAGFEVVHVYLSQRLLDLAARDVFSSGHGAVRLREVSGGHGAVRLREVSGGHDELLARLVRSLLQEMTSKPRASVLYLESIGQALAVHLVRCYSDDGGSLSRANALPAYKLHRAIETMRDGLDKAFDLGRLASQASMSVSHFSRLFSKATGRSPSRYFIHLRMETARQLLLESDLSILEVALEVGYASPSHFAQVFKRYSGVTPREYRHPR